MITGETSEERDSSNETCPGKGSQVGRVLLANKCFYPQREITLLGSLNYRRLSLSDETLLDALGCAL